MITKPVIKENFIEFLKTNYPECFESGTPITENSLEALIILKKRESIRNNFVPRLQKMLCKLKRIRNSKIS